MQASVTSPNPDHDRELLQQRHDYINILSRLMLALELAKTAAADTPKAVLRIDRALTDIGLLDDLVRPLFGGSQKPTLLTRDPGTVLHRIVDGAAQELGAHVSIRYRAFGVLPSVRVSASTLDRSVSNVVLNGIRAASEWGGGEVRVMAGVFELRTEVEVAFPPSRIPAGHYLRVTVMNHGVFGAGVRDQLFQAPVTTKPGADTTAHGYGLLSVKTLVEEHGGGIDVQEAGGTVRVHLYFPTGVE